jgi:PAS domain S-box-containing protein
MSDGEKNVLARSTPDLRLIVAALLVPFAAFGLQLYFWSAIQPYVWFLFFPAVFFSSWIGGKAAGLATTGISALLVWWVFIPPRYSFKLEHPTSLISIGVFAGMGVLFSLTHERLRKANRRAAEALAEVNTVNEHLEERISERTMDLARTIEALQESEAKYRHTLDTMLEGCQIIGFDWRYLYFNGTMEKQSRRPMSELIGRTMQECWPGIAETELFTILKNCMEERTTRTLDNEFVFPDGHRGWFRLIIQPVTEGIAIFSEDITDRKQTESEILELNAQLEQRVAERTARIEAVNRELESFTYSVSHDLKAPLRGIDGYSRLLEEDYHDRLDPEALRFIANVRHGVAQMHELIEDLLSYSRMERRSLQNVTLDLSALVQAVLGEIAEDMARSGARLHVDVPSINVLADREGLSMVLRNLLENALKFSRDANPPEIEIRARGEADRVILSVRDNGIGFDMKYHDRIFDIFQRLQRSEEYPGTGIGLALVRKAMQRIGGRVRAESAPGEGATFYLEIPT